MAKDKLIVTIDPEKSLDAPPSLRFEGFSIEQIDRMIEEADRRSAELTSWDDAMKPLDFSSVL